MSEADMREQASSLLAELGFAVDAACEFDPDVGLAPSVSALTALALAGYR